MKQALDVAFVGNGIIALSIVWELKRRDPTLQIGIIGPASQTGGASTAAGAMLGCYAEITHSSLNSRSGRQKFELSRQASNRWASWVDEINDATIGEKRFEISPGTIVIENAVSGTLDSDNFDAIISRLNIDNEPYHVVEPRHINGIKPVPSARPMRAIYLPKEGAVNGSRFLSVLQQLLKRLGIKFFDQRCVRIIANSSKVLGIELDNGDQIDVSKVVCAAGSFSTPILDTVLDPVLVQPVFAASGIAFVSDRSDRKVPPSHTIRSVNRAGSCGLHVVHFDESLDYVGATNAIFAKPAFQATAGLSHFLLQCAIDQIDQWYAHAPIDHWRIGNRPVTLDTFPLIGAGGIDGLSIATGTYRDGFHMSPIIGQMIADEILDGETKIRHSFQPTRRPISVLSIAESLAECSRHTISTGFEASLVLPRLWPDEALGALIPASNGRLYDALQIEDGLSPDLIPFLNAGINGDSFERLAFDRAKLVLMARGVLRDR